MKIKNIVIAALFFSINLIYGQDNLFLKIDGWKTEVEKQVYDPSNLWNIIDGAADLFLEYSFVNLHLVRYTNSSGIEIKAELYKHSSPLTAFGMYSQERDPDYHYIKAGTQGYLEPGILNFLDGNYYIKLSSNQSGNEVQSSLQLIAEKIGGGLNLENNLPKILKVFPSQGKQINSEQFIAQNFLGYSFLKSAFISSYKGTSSFKMFVIENEKREAANSVLDKLILTIPKENVVKISDGYYELNDPNNGIITIALMDKYLFGTIDCLDKNMSERLIKELSDNLLKNIQ